MKEHWNERYQREAYLYGEAPNAFIDDISQQIPFQGESLAIAEGEGRNALYLVKQAQLMNRAMNMTLWDYSEIGLAKAAERAKQENLTIQTECLDLNDANWHENTLDNVFCVFGHFPSTLKEKTLQGIRTALRNNGWFVGEVYSKDQLRYKTGGPPVEELLYDLHDFIHAFGKDHMHHLFLGEVNRMEGKLHTGLCHVIQFAIQVKK